MPIPGPADDRTRRAIDTIFRLLEANGTWPTYQLLDRHLAAAGEPDPLDALRAAGSDLIYGLGHGNAPPSDSQPIALSFAALQACNQAANDVTAFMTAIDIACQALADAPPTEADVTIASDDLREALDLPSGDPVVARVFHELGVEPWGSKGSWHDPETGAWQFQLHPPQLRRMIAAVTPAEAWELMHPIERPFDHAGNITVVQRDISRNVWVVFGRNTQAKDAMFDFLRALGLVPMEFSSVIARTGSASPYVGQILDTAFADAQAVVVLLTPDEVAYLRGEHAEHDGETAAGDQARPNVLFEAGMAMGRHPDRTVLVELGNLRPFSDVGGRHTVRLGTTTGTETLNDLASRLEAAGCPVDKTGSAWLKPDRFVVPERSGLPLGKKVPSASARPPHGIKLGYFPSGGNGGGRMHVRNIGTETLYDIDLTLPDEVQMFSFHHDGPIRKIPPGETVKVSAIHSRAMGYHGPTSFDVTVTARTEDGDNWTADVFLDIGG